MKIVHTFLFALFVSASLFAQKLDREKIKALKIAHITEQLDLNKTEAEKFWPIYNANEDAKNKLSEISSNKRKDTNEENLSEEDAKSLLLAIEKIEKQKMDLHSKFLKDLLVVLPAKKIIKLYQAERSFRQKMFDEYKKRHAKE